MFLYWHHRTFCVNIIPPHTHITHTHTGKTVHSSSLRRRHGRDRRAAQEKTKKKRTKNTWWHEHVETSFENQSHKTDIQNERERELNEVNKRWNLFSFFLLLQSIWKRWYFGLVEQCYICVSLRWLSFRKKFRWPVGIIKAKDKEKHWRRNY